MTSPLGTTASILLRELDDANQAARYAERMAARTERTHPEMSRDYLTAASELRGLPTIAQSRPNH